jgi:hypothetical protein
VQAERQLLAAVGVGPTGGGDREPMLAEQPRTLGGDQHRVQGGGIDRTPVRDQPVRLVPGQQVFAGVPHDRPDELERRPVPSLGQQRPRPPC